MTSPTQPEASAERREQVRALWRRYGGTLRSQEQFGVAATNQLWPFIAALDAQAKAEADARVAETQTVAFQAQEMAKEIASNADARVEAMRERACTVIIRLMTGVPSIRDKALMEAHEAVGALPIEGDR